MKAEMQIRIIRTKQARQIRIRECASSAYHVPVALLRVELDGEAPRVTDGVAAAGLESNGGEASQDGGLVANFAEEIGLAQVRDVLREKTGGNHLVKASKLMKKEWRQIETGRACHSRPNAASTSEQHRIIHT